MKQYLQNKKGLVQNVFDKVFDQYDLMNDIMSLGIHRLWKRRLLDWMRPNEDDCLVDVASGTGDIAESYLKRIQFKGDRKWHLNLMICLIAMTPLRLQA